MSMKGVVLCYKGNQVFTDIGNGYLLYVCEKKVLEELTPSQTILLVEQTIQEHIRRTIN